MKKKIVGTTVTEASAQALLRRQGGRQLAPVEDRLIRMRLGASQPRQARIEWMGTDSEELAIELRAIEIETYLKLKAHRARNAARAAAPAVASAASRTRDKIVRALRRRGPNR
ncbi:MAG: hypothetical protein WCK73_06340 [Deltaproteobacteria bacterium]